MTPPKRDDLNFNFLLADDRLTSNTVMDRTNSSSTLDTERKRDAMPRSARACEPHDILGIVVRVHEGRPILVSEDDHRFFVDRLRRVVSEPL